MKQYKEMFNDVEVRMIQKDDGTIYAVLQDVMYGLGRTDDKEINRIKHNIIELYGENYMTSCHVNFNNSKGNKYYNYKGYAQLCIKEEAIYYVILSNKPSKRKQSNDPLALPKWKAFNHFVTKLIREYREKYNLSIFNMYDVQLQKQGMDKVKSVLDYMEEQEKEVEQNVPNYAIVNKQVNEIVCDYYNIDYIKKDGMTLEQRKFRIKILKEYVDIFEYTHSKSESNMLIRRKYQLIQKGKGKKIFA